MIKNNKDNFINRIKKVKAERFANRIADIKSNNNQCGVIEQIENNLEYDKMSKEDEDMINKASCPGIKHTPFKVVFDRAWDTSIMDEILNTAREDNEKFESKEK
jgi:hypothetical protein